jgi:hypothetical protein
MRSEACSSHELRNEMRVTSQKKEKWLLNEDQVFSSRGGSPLESKTPKNRPKAHQFKEE